MIQSPGEYSTGAVVRLIVEDGINVEEVSELLDIHHNSLFRWESEYGKYGRSAFPGNEVGICDRKSEISCQGKKNGELDSFKQLQAFLKQKRR